MGAVGAGGGGGGLGTHWKPLLKDVKTQTKKRRRVAGAVGVDKAVGAVGAVGAEGVWAHIGSLEILVKD